MNNLLAFVVQQINEHPGVGAVLFAWLVRDVKALKAAILKAPQFIASTYGFVSVNGGVFGLVKNYILGKKLILRTVALDAKFVPLPPSIVASVPVSQPSTPKQ